MRPLPKLDKHHSPRTSHSVKKENEDMKLSKAAYLFAVAAGLAFSLCSLCHARDKRPGVRTRNAQVVQVDLGNAAGGWGYEPLDFLSGALTHHPDAHFFRVTWSLIIGSLSSTITVLYD